MTYVTGDALAYYDTKLKSYIDNKLKEFSDDLELQTDLYSYGVQWKKGTNQLSRVGNLSYHKSLPIHTKLKGCIAKGNSIQYYLNPDDWDLPIENSPEINKINIASLTDTELKVASYTNIGDVFQKGMRVRFIVDTDNVDTSNFIYDGEVTIASSSSITVTLDKKIQTGSEDPVNDLTYTIKRLPRFDGYDGQVMIEVQKFYLWSTTENDNYRVNISEKKLVDYALEIPHMLVGAYKATMLRNVPENMGWLSTLKANTLISVSNKNNYCRGNSNRENRDSLNKFETDLQKPCTSITKVSAEQAARLCNNHVLCYEYYKAIFYWLFVIEYCNFDCQAAFSAELTADGYHQGGLGTGVTNLNTENWNKLTNGLCNIIPIGSTNNIGNKSGTYSEDLYVSSSEEKIATTYPNRYRGFECPFGEIWTNLQGCICQNSNQVHNIYTTTDYNLYNVTDLSQYKFKGTQINQNGYIQEINLGKQGEIIPSAINSTYSLTKKDYSYKNDNNGLFTLLLGGGAHSGSAAGVGYFYSNNGFSYTASNVAFRIYTLLY